VAGLLEEQSVRTIPVIRMDIEKRKILNDLIICSPPRNARLVSKLPKF